MVAIAPSFYFEHLYPLQDDVLQQIAALDTGFHLSGGTASSRGYLNHRFSDDLDLCVNCNTGGRTGGRTGCPPAEAGFPWQTPVSTRIVRWPKDDSQA